LKKYEKVRKTKRQEKQFFCPAEGCTKAYVGPDGLAQHMKLHQPLPMMTTMPSFAHIDPTMNSNDLFSPMGMANEDFTNYQYFDQNQNLVNSPMIYQFGDLNLSLDSAIDNSVLNFNGDSQEIYENKLELSL
jgi:hypothetical protein